eukprot:g30995.t1
MSWWLAGLDIQSTKKYNLAARWLLRQSGVVRQRGEEFDPADLTYQQEVKMPNATTGDEEVIIPEDPLSGINKLLNALEEMTGRTALDKRGELRHVFYLELKRRGGERISEFTTRFRTLVSEMKSEGVVISDNELGWWLKHKLGLDALRSQLLETALGGSEDYGTIEREAYEADKFTFAHLSECIQWRNRIGLDASFCEDPVLQGFKLAKAAKGLSQKVKSAALAEAQTKAQEAAAAGELEQQARELIGPRGGLPTLRKDLVKLAALLNVPIQASDTVEQIKEKVKPTVALLKEGSKPSAKAKAKGDAKKPTLAPFIVESTLYKNLKSEASGSRPPENVPWPQVQAMQKNFQAALDRMALEMQELRNARWEQMTEPSLIADTEMGCQVGPDGYQAGPDMEELYKIDPDFRAERDHEHMAVIGGAKITSPAGVYPLPLARAMVRGLEAQFEKDYKPREAAIKRLHENTGHRSNVRLARALTLAGAPAEAVVAAKRHQCAFQIIHGAASDSAAPGATVEFPNGNAGKKSGRMVLDGAKVKGNTVQVPLTTVDALVRDLKLSKVDILIIDTEGADPAVLRGAAKTLGSVRCSASRPASKNEELLGEVRPNESCWFSEGRSFCMWMPLV